MGIPELVNYRSGYSIGVGGVVLCGDKALLVRAATGRRRGEWMIPGGFVGAGETIDAAVRREVMEETGVEAEVEGVIAARNRVMAGENSAYFIFQLRASSEEARPDEVEVDRARFFAAGGDRASAALECVEQIGRCTGAAGQHQLAHSPSAPHHTR